MSEERACEVSTPSTPGKVGWILFLLPVLFAGLVRFGLTATMGPVRLIGDEIYYVDTALNIREGEGHYSSKRNSRMGWPPLHPAVLSTVLDPDRGSGDDLQGLADRLVLFQALLGTVLVFALVWVGRLLFDSKTAFVAGVVAAIYPTLVAYSHYLWSETLFLTLLLFGIGSALCSRKRGAWIPAIVSGSCFGLAGLTREVAIFVAGATALWMMSRTKSVEPVGVAGDGSCRRSPSPLLLGMLVLSTAAVVILPWTYRNYRLSGRFVPVSTAGWMGLREGNTLTGEDWLRPDLRSLAAFRDEYLEIDEEGKRADFAKSQALELIQAEQPAWVFKKILRNTALLFSPDTFLFKKISRQCYGEIAPATRRILILSTVFSYVLVVTCGLFGIAAAGFRGRRSLALLLIVAAVGLHIFANASSRYRLPLVPVLILYGSYGMLSPLQNLRSLPKLVWIPTLLVWLFFLVWCCPYFYEDAVSLWNRGTYVEAWRP